MGSMTVNPFQNVPAGRTGKLCDYPLCQPELRKEKYLESLDALITLFREDKDPNRTDLLVGVYKTDEGEAYVLPSIKEV